MDSVCFGPFGSLRIFLDLGSFRPPRRLLPQETTSLRLGTGVRQRNSSDGFKFKAKDGIIGRHLEDHIWQYNWELWGTSGRHSGDNRDTTSERQTRDGWVTSGRQHLKDNWETSGRHSETIGGPILGDSWELWKTVPGDNLDTRQLRDHISETSGRRKQQAEKPWRQLGDNIWEIASG